MDRCNFLSKTPFTAPGVRHELAGSFTPEDAAAPPADAANTGTPSAVSTTGEIVKKAVEPRSRPSCPTKRGVAQVIAAHGEAQKTGYRAVVDALVELATVDFARGIEGPGAAASHRGAPWDAIPAPFVLWEFIATGDDFGGRKNGT